MMAAPHPNQYTPPTFTCVITYGEETDKYLTDFKEARLRIAREYLEKLNTDELEAFSKLLDEMLA